MNDGNTKTLDDRLNEVDYSFINGSRYLPSKFAAKFMAFVKLVSGKNSGLDESPPFHMEMLDKIAKYEGKVGSFKLANCCHRGASKTTLFGEFLIPYVAIFGSLPGLPRINGIVYVGDTMENGAKNLRKNLEFRYKNSEFLQEYLPEAKFTDAYIEFTNMDGIRTGIKLIGAKTGIRGIKIFGDRPQLAILDDLVSDEDARSMTSIAAINTTIYKCVIPALDPKQSMIIANGTPFNKFDPMVRMVESGVWDTNVYPICNRYPCSKEEFIGSWETRFSYEYVKDKYDTAVGAGDLSNFYQEYMLRITSEEDRLVTDSEILWHKRQTVFADKNAYNFYITTDFATSSRQTADFTVIAVWAYDKDGNWLLVDGMCRRTTMDITVDKLFELVEEYEPISVGLENTGQQGGIITLIKREMTQRAIWFNLARHGSNEGIRSTGDKLSRFNAVVPLFKIGKIFLPEELNGTSFIGELIDELRLATASGLKGKDDWLDVVSQLNLIKAWKPSGRIMTQRNVNKPNMFGEFMPNESHRRIKNFIV